MRTLPCHLPGVHLSELCAKKLSLVGGGALWWAHVVAVTGEARRPREGGGSPLFRLFRLLAFPDTGEEFRGQAAPPRILVHDPGYLTANDALE